MFVACSIKQLPDSQQLIAAHQAIDINPVNSPPEDMLTRIIRAVRAILIPETSDETEIIDPAHLAILTSKYWGAGGVKLGVSFLDTNQTDLIGRILAHMNAWGEFCNVKFSWSQSQGEVRITRQQGGYWSYLGTDILQIPGNQPTMNLQGFTMQTSEAEYIRVVRHETGHTLGFPHEHMRGQIVARLDVNKTIAYFRQTQGWSAQVTRQQVLTPLEESSITGTVDAEIDSIMCYQLPGDITKDGMPIPGGTNINAGDRQFATKLYPLATQPPVQPPELTMAAIHILDQNGQVIYKFNLTKG